MFHFACPWLFILLPLPLVARHWLPASSPSQPVALKIPFYQRITQLTADLTQAQSSSMAWRTAVLVTVWSLLLIAASGPEWIATPLGVLQSGRDIMLAIDLSGSMQIPDMSPNSQSANRLTLVKAVATEFIKHRQGDRLGLILFGSKAYLQTPLTFDLITVQAQLDDASIGLAGVNTAIGDAIGLAIKRLANSPQQSRVLILLTDGGNNSGTVDPLVAANMAAKAGIKIYTIGIGADAITVQGLFGTEIVNTTNNLDQALLQHIAHVTGGLFFRAKDSDALHNAYQQLDQLEPVVSDRVILHTVTPLYQWPLLLALLISTLIGLHTLPKTHRKKLEISKNESFS